MDQEQSRRFATLLAIAADSPADLRRCDVYRVVEAAQDAGMAGFADWLAGERPDLEDEILTAQADIAPTTDWASTASPEHFAGVAARANEMPAAWLPPPDDEATIVAREDEADRRAWLEEQEAEWRAQAGEGE